MVKRHRARKIESVIVEALEIHDKLNPKIWDSNDNLLPDVKDKILDIVDEFEKNVKEMTEIDLKPIDIYLLGSNASYNYTSHSDIDVHIVINFDLIDNNTGLVQSLMNLQKSEFNSNYDISIHGIDVELYVEDVRASTLSNGIYSVMSDEWIKKPEPITDVPEINIESEIDEWTEKIQDILDSDDADDISKAIDDLYLIRKNGLLSDGEYGKGNQLFKEIRNLGLLDDLKDAYIKVKSKDLSLEKKGVKCRPMIRYLEDRYDDYNDSWYDDGEDYAYAKKFKYDIFADNEYRSVMKHTNDPEEAIEIWFRLESKFPSDTAILTTRDKFARELLDVATEDYIIELYDTYNIPYDLDWFLDMIKKGFTPGTFDERGDWGEQITPFSYG